jgi:hypothetical protein
MGPTIIGPTETRLAELLTRHNRLARRIN